MAYSRKDVEKTKMNAKKFVRYQEGAEKYSMGLTKFTELAKEAKAVYKIDKVKGIWRHSTSFNVGTKLELCRCLHSAENNRLNWA